MSEALLVKHMLWKLDIKIFKQVCKWSNFLVTGLVLKVTWLSYHSKIIEFWLFSNFQITRVADVKAHWLLRITVDIPEFQQVTFKTTNTTFKTHQFQNQAWHF